MSMWLGFAVALGVLAAATGFGLWWRRRQGRPQPVATGRRSADPARPGEVRYPQVLSALGVEPDTPVTLLQFSSAFCAPCRATRVVCGRLAEERDEVRHLEVDAESHLAEVRALGIWRTPTVLVIDQSGAVVSRITGAPTRAQVLAAVAPLQPQVARS